ncbi:cache domain-containing protein [Pseudanabaena sp. Chao 1811]|uniref:cache domain-containing protein n=1 Tax=Pseudanabaena sp. Chao 1811 TaxID=2963092 RepID=UPI0022F3AD65|nr:cache domain-containing protein [Pseudanabaena sp. Chao 1811]
MQLRIKVPLLITLVTFIASLLLTLFFYQTSLQSIENNQKEELATTVTLIQKYTDEQTKKALSRAELVASLPSVQQAFRAKDRDQLAQILVPTFLIQRDRYEVRDAHFHLAPATSFLRLFYLKNYGEDLTSFRETVVITNQKQEPQSGVEISRHGLNIRGVVPISDAQGAIGSFEVGMSFNSVLEAVKQITGFELGVFVDNELMTKVATGLPAPESDRVIGGLRNENATNWGFIRPLLTPDVLRKVNDTTVKVQKIDGIDYGIALVPLLDFKGKKIGVIVAGKSFQALTSQANAILVNSLVIALFEVIVLAGTATILFNGLLMRPMVAVGSYITSLAIGDTVAKSIEDLAIRKDEVGKIARGCELLQQKLKEDSKGQNHNA